MMLTLHTLVDARIPKYDLGSEGITLVNFWTVKDGVDVAQAVITPDTHRDTRESQHLGKLMKL
jgi:hypothetical protein